jgi:hypothetical protein
MPVKKQREFYELLLSFQNRKRADKSILAFLLFTFDKLSIKRLTKVLPPLTI